MPTEHQITAISDAIALWGVLFLLAMVPAAAPLDQQPLSVYQPGRGFQADRATPEEVKARLAKGEDMLVVDVRAHESYEAEHITGAVNSPWKDLAQGHAMLPKQRLLLLYCT